MTEALDPKIASLSNSAKDVGAALFGMMRPGSQSELRLRLVKSKPTLETQRALDDMVAAGVVKLACEGTERVYKPLLSFHPLLAAKMTALLEGTATEGKSLFESIEADKGTSEVPHGSARKGRSEK